MKGSDKISLKMNAIGFGGMVYEVATAYVEAKGSGEGKKTGAQGRRRRRPGRHRRRHRRAAAKVRAIGAAVGAVGGAAVASGRRRAPEIAGRNAAAVSAHRRRQHSRA